MNLLVKTLLDTFNDLDRTRALLASALRSQDPLLHYLPTYDGDDPVEDVIRSMTAIWHPKAGEELLDAGLICVDNNTLAAIEAFNEAKSLFKNAADAIRKNNKSNATLVAMADKHLGGDTRDAALRDAMQTARISELDLLKCYKIIRVLPATLESLSWTWATQHTKSERISMDNAVKMAEEQLSGEARDAVLADLGRLKPGTRMTRLLALPNQLRANIIWDDDGERSRKMISISGIVAFPGNQLPKLVWRDNPGDTVKDGLTRFDATIDRTPYIHSLGIHLYKGEGQ